MYIVGFDLIYGYSDSKFKCKTNGKLLFYELRVTFFKKNTFILFSLFSSSMFLIVLLCYYQDILFYTHLDIKMSTYIIEQKIQSIKIINCWLLYVWLLN